MSISQIDSGRSSNRPSDRVSSGSGIAVKYIPIVAIFIYIQIMYMGFSLFLVPIWPAFCSQISHPLFMDWIEKFNNFCLHHPIISGPTQPIFFLKLPDLPFAI